MDHPEFQEQAAKIEETRRRKLGRIAEIIRCSKANFEAEHGWEMRAIEAAHAGELQGAKEELLRRGLDKQPPPPAAAAAAAVAVMNGPGVSDAATSSPPAPEEAPTAAAAPPPPAEASAGPTAPAAAAEPNPAPPAPAAGVILEAIGATTAAAGRKLVLDTVLAELREHPMMRAEQGPTGAGSLDGGGGGGGGGGPSFSSSSSSSRSGSGSGTSLGVGRLPSDPSWSSAELGEDGGEEEGSDAEFMASDDTDEGDAAASGYRDIVDIFQERLLQSERPKPAQRRKRRRKWGRGRPWTR